MSTATTHIETNKQLVPALRFKDFDNNMAQHLFENIFLFSSGKNIKQAEASPEFETPCVRYGELYHMYGEVINQAINRTNLDASELLFSKGDEILLPSAGEDPLDIGSASALTLENVAIGRTINILRPLEDNIYSQIFASYYINEKLRKKISTLARGASISNVYNSDLKKLKINLPSLPEQQKIASFLSAVDEKIQQLTKKKGLLEQYKKGVMQALFSGTLRFKNENGNPYPDWEEKRLGEIGKTFNGLTGKTKEDFGEGKPYIQYMQIFSGSKINPAEFGYVSLNDNEKQSRAQFGDAFFTTSSETPKEIGTASVLLDEIEELYLNSFCFGYRPNNIEILVPQFLQFLLRSEIFRRKIIPLAQGSTRYNMSKVELLKLRVDIPHKEEQQKIASYLSSIDTKIERVNQQITQSQTFKKGLLQQMFV
jgi:type I restriction enzyme S subunit